MQTTQATHEHLQLIHRFVPAQAAAPGTTLLLLHGTGGDETNLLDLGQALAPQAALLSPRGSVSENGMPRFFRRLAEGVFDEADLQQRTHELADFVAAAADCYGFDARRVVAAGFSNGANIAVSTLLLRPGVLAGALLLRPMVPLVPADLPDLRGVPVYIGAGQRDPIATPQQSERLALLLQSAGASVDLRWQPGGHMLHPGEVQQASAWLRAHGLV